MNRFNEEVKEMDLQRALKRPFLRYPMALWALLGAGVVLAFTSWAPAPVVLTALGFPIYWYIRLFQERHEYLLPFAFRLLLNALVLAFFVGHDANRAGFYFIDLVGTFLTIGIAVVGLSLQRFVGYTWRELIGPHIMYVFFVAPALPFIVVSAIMRAMGYPF